AELERDTVVDELGEALVELPPLAVDGLAQRVRGGPVDRRDRLVQRAVHWDARGVLLAALAPLDVAGILERRLLGVCRLDARPGVLLELGEAVAAERGRRAR